jgi:hypothetical protein
MTHRYKFYAAETGTAYQFFFAHSRRVNRPDGQGKGNDYVFVVTADQSPPFTLRVFIAERALEVWRQTHGRVLDPNEMYAAAKMRMFRAFDEIEILREDWLNVLVDESNIEELLGPLNL